MPIFVGVSGVKKCGRAGQSQGQEKELGGTGSRSWKQEPTSFWEQADLVASAACLSVGLPSLSPFLTSPLLLSTSYFTSSHVYSHLALMTGIKKYWNVLLNYSL